MIAQQQFPIRNGFAVYVTSTGARGYGYLVRGDAENFVLSPWGTDAKTFDSMELATAWLREAGFTNSTSVGYRHAYVCHSLVRGAK